MKWNGILAAAALALVSTNVFAADAAPKMVSFKAWALAKIYFVNLETNQELIFTPQITGTKDEGTLSGYVEIKIPEGVYLMRGQQHMPAELGTVCQVEDRVIVAKANVEANAVKSAAFGYASNATGEGRLKQVCWEDFDAIDRVPDFRSK